MTAPAPASPAPAIEIAGLDKRFGKRPAVVGLDLRIEPGEMVGLLGHNGAGKSTTLGCLLGQCFPDTGTLRVRGHDVFRDRAAALRRVGAIFETPCFYGYLSGMDNLKPLARLSGRVTRRQIDAVVDRVGLTDRIHDKVSRYSHGMRQRLAFAQALLPDPELVILDEPTDGLDPAGIVETRRLIEELHRDHGLTVLLASHQLAEVERLCDRVVVMERGKKVFDGPWRAAPGFDRVIEIDVDRPEAALSLAVDRGLAAGEAATQADASIPRWRLSATADSTEVNRLLVERGFAVRSIAPLRPRLEDLYLELRHGASAPPRPADPPAPSPREPAAAEAAR